MPGICSRPRGAREGTGAAAVRDPGAAGCWSPAGSRQSQHLSAAGTEPEPEPELSLSNTQHSWDGCCVLDSVEHNQPALKEPFPASPFPLQDAHPPIPLNRVPAALVMVLRRHQVGLGLLRPIFLAQRRG